MNETENETVRFCMKPNPSFYALRFTSHRLLMGSFFGGMPLALPLFFSKSGIVLLLATYVPLGLAIFIVAFVTARHLSWS
jgi:hypothetical protein